MKLLQVIQVMLVLGFICEAHGVRFVDKDNSNIELIAKSICDVNKGFDIQIGHLETIGRLLTYFKELPPRQKLSACRIKYLDSVIELNELISKYHGDVCSDDHLKRIEEFHKAYVSKISKHVKYRKANHLAAPWLLIMFFVHYAGATGNYCEARAVSILEQEETGAQDSRDMEDVDRLLKQFTETLGMKTDFTQWNKDVYLIWNLVDDLPSSKKFRKYLADGDERLFIRVQDADKLISLQNFCVKQKPRYGNVLLPLIRLADMGYFRAGGSRLNGIHSLKRHYMMVQMCETLLPIKVLENDGALKPGQIVLVPVEEAERVGYKKTSIHSEPILRSGPPFRFLIDQENAVMEVNNLLETVKSRDKTISRLVKNMAKNMVRKMKSKAGQLLVRDGKKNQDYGLVVESSLNKLEKDDSDWSELNEPSHNRGLARNKRGVMDFFVAWKDLALNIIDGIAFTIGIVFLFAIKVALVFIVFIYRLGRSITGFGYKPLENMFEYVWNGGYRITRTELDLSDGQNKLDFKPDYDKLQRYHQELKHDGLKHQNSVLDRNHVEDNHNQQPHLDNHQNPQDRDYGPPPSHYNPGRYDGYEHEKMDKELKKSKSRNFYGYGDRR